MRNHRRVFYLTLFASLLVLSCNSLWSQTYEDKTVCLRVTVPPDWQIETQKSKFAKFVYNRDARITVLTDPNEAPVTLEQTLQVLNKNGYDRYTESVQDIKVDGISAVLLTLSPSLDTRSLIVLVNPACGTNGTTWLILTNQENPRELEQFVKGVHILGSEYSP